MKLSNLESFVWKYKSSYQSVAEEMEPNRQKEKVEILEYRAPYIPTVYPSYKCQPSDYYALNG